MNRTLVKGARTVLLASGLERCWWHHAVMCQTFLQNIKYSPLTRSSPHLLMFGAKSDVSFFQELGVEAWLHLRVGQRADSKFDSRVMSFCPISRDFWCGALAVVPRK
jgi:hypothetical protein